MRLLASGDNHWRKGLRFTECLAVHAFMVEQARELNADVFLCPGDVFDEESEPDEREAVADWMTALTEQCPIVIAKGNHDRPLDVAFFRRLKTKHPIIVEERAAVHYVAGAAIATMAWPDRATLMAALQAEKHVGSAAADIDTRRLLQAVLTHLGFQLEQHDGPRILLGHFMVDGSVTSTGQPLLGMPINVSLADLALARAHLTVMAHIHKAQSWELETGPAIYTGSPFRTDFGQVEPKSILFAEFDGERLLRTEQLETPCAPMVHMETTWNGSSWDSFEGPVAETYRGAELRLRYRVNADQRDSAAASARDWADALVATYGAKSVKVEEVVIATKRARAPEVARAVSVQDKLAAHWASIGYEPETELREALYQGAAELEQEAVNAAS